MSSHETDEDGPAWPPSIDSLRRSLVDPNTGDVYTEGASFLCDAALPTTLEEDLERLAKGTGARLTELVDMEEPVLWVCRAKPASLNGATCGHAVRKPIRGPGTRSLCCDKCGATEKASRDREERELRRSSPKRKVGR